jgi:hypothetical protein
MLHLIGGHPRAGGVRDRALEEDRDRDALRGQPGYRWRSLHGVGPGDLQEVERPRDPVGPIGRPRLPTGNYIGVGMAYLIRSFTG